MGVEILLVTSMHQIPSGATARIPYGLWWVSILTYFVVRPTKDSWEGYTVSAQLEREACDSRRPLMTTRCDRAGLKKEDEDQEPTGETAEVSLCLGIWCASTVKRTTGSRSTSSS